MTTPTGQAPPGWYPTPAGTTAWWDGQRWHQTPPAGTPGYVAPTAAAAAPYKKVATVSALVRTAYLFLALASAAQIGVSLWRRDLVAKLVAGTSVDAEVARNADDLAKLVNIAVLVLAVLGFALAADLCKRMFSNLHGELRSRGLDYTPGWAAGWWFVPFANFVKPVQVVREAWKASSPTEQPGSMAWKVTKAPALIGIWWAFFIFAAIGALTTGSGDEDGALSPTEFQAEMVRTAAVGGLRLMAAVLAVAVFTSVTKRHLARARWLGVITP